jgi:transcriptional regulator with XRE-family HTH domain
MRVCLNDYDSGSFIKIIREWTGLTQTEFGARIGKSERTVQEYESGKINYDIKVLNKISKEFNIDIVAEKK